jgi:hypothetical protein
MQSRSRGLVLSAKPVGEIFNYRLVNAREVDANNVVDCLLYNEIDERDLVFCNATGCYYSGTTLRSYFGDSSCSKDPMERVMYRNPFLAETPESDGSIACELMRSWNPLFVPVTFCAGDVKTRPEWLHYVRTKIIWFLHDVLNDERLKSCATYKFKLLKRLCEGMEWYDIKTWIP